MGYRPSKNKWAVVLASVIITSCANQQQPIQVEYNCPVINFPSDPIPMTRTLTAKSTPDQVIKAWVATAVAYRGWNKTVRRQIENSA